MQVPILFGPTDVDGARGHHGVAGRNAFSGRHAQVLFLYKQHSFKIIIMIINTLKTCGNFDKAAPNSERKEMLYPKRPNRNYTFFYLTRLGL
jgi:hypothetical protein